jgi:hypothetical protein
MAFGFSMDDVMGGGPSEATAWCTPGASEKAARHKTHESMCRRERLATPPAFRDLLLSIARSAHA